MRKTPTFPYNRSYFLPVYEPEQVPKYFSEPHYSNRNIFSGFEDDDDPRPKWGTPVAENRPATTKRPKKIQKYVVRSHRKRKTKPGATTGTVPFVQQINRGKIPLNMVEDTERTKVKNVSGQPVKSVRKVSSHHPRPTVKSPEVKTSTASSLPSNPTTPTNLLSGPSKCAWAVVSCCSDASTKTPDYCFEERGCPGPFWDRSPCESDFAKAAIKRALKFYN